MADMEKIYNDLIIINLYFQEYFHVTYVVYTGELLGAFYWCYFFSSLPLVHYLLQKKTINQIHQIQHRIPNGWNFKKGISLRPLLPVLLLLQQDY